MKRDRAYGWKEKLVVIKRNGVTERPWGKMLKTQRREEIYGKKEL